MRASKRRRAAKTWRGWSRFCRRRSGRSRCLAAAGGRRRRATRFAPLSGSLEFAGCDVVSRQGPVWTIAIRFMRATWASVSIRSSGARIAQADVLVVIGPRLGEMTTNGYTRLAPPVPQQRLIHVYPGAEELNRVYQAELGIPSGIEAFAQGGRGDETACRAFAGASGRRRRAPTMRRSCARLAFRARSIRRRFSLG